MLPPFIIEQIRKREEERRHQERPFLELPVPMPPSRKSEQPDEDHDRGVVIVDLGSEDG